MSHDISNDTFFRDYYLTRKQKVLLVNQNGNIHNSALLKYRIG